MLIIEKVEKLTAGTTAKTVQVNCRSFLLQNRSDSAVVYFKEKAKDGAAATENNAFALGAGQTTDHVLCAQELSVIASAASTDVRILYVTEDN